MRGGATHVLDAPTISDGEFDAMMRRAQRARGRLPRIAYAGLADPAGRRSAVDHLHGGEHLQRLMSLDNAFSREELDRWVARAVRELGEKRLEQSGYLCELKVDGLALDLVYEKGG